MPTLWIRLVGFITFLFDISLVCKILESREACVSKSFSFSVVLIDNVKELDDHDVSRFSIEFTCALLWEFKITFDDFSSSLVLKSSKWKVKYSWKFTFWHVTAYMTYMTDTPYGIPIYSIKYNLCIYLSFDLEECIFCSVAIFSCRGL